MAETTRALRRHHRARLKKARRFRWHRDLFLEPAQLGMLVDTPTPCSCPSCGNSRTHFGERTIQERRQLAVLRESLRDPE